MGLLQNILSLGTKPQLRFHHLIADFRERLSDPEKHAEVTFADIEEFYQNLNAIDFRLVPFSTYYKKYIANLNRVRPDTDNLAIDRNLLKVAISENAYKPTEPYPILKHRIKYDYLLTSKFFIKRQKKENLKKLNTPVPKSKSNDPSKPTKEWTRVPIPRHHPKR